MDRISTHPPDIEEALRNPANEQAYSGDYNRLLTERVMSAVGDVLKEDSKKDETEQELRSLLEGEDGSMVLEGRVVKALSESGLLRVASITGRTDVDAKNGWVERQRMPEWEKQVGHEVWGVVEQYYVELPKDEGQAPVTTRLVLEAKQQKLEGVRNRYGGDMWGDIDYNKWTLSRTSY